MHEGRGRKVGRDEGACFMVKRFLILMFCVGASLAQPLL